MTTETAAQETSGLDVHDVLFALLRHKWKVLLLTILGLAAAAAFYLLAPNSYQSETKLLLKYVLDRSAVDTMESQTEVSGRYSDILVGAELAILSSWDLAVAVAEAVGPDRLLAGVPGEHSAARAAGVVLGGLEVKATKGSNVISVTFHNEQPGLPRPVLEELVRRYFDKHLEVHRSMQAFDFVSQQKDLVRARLNDLDAKIKTLKEQAGITSLADSEALLQSQITRTRQELLSAEADRAEQGARSAFMVKSASTMKSTEPNPAETKVDPNAIPPAILQQYQALVEQLAFYRRNETELLARYTEESAEVSSSHARVAQLQERRRKLETEYPALATVAVKTSGLGKPDDAMGEQARLAGTEAKVAALKTQLNELQVIAGRINAVSSQLRDLESQRQVEQKNYADFQLKLEKSRIDEALDPSKIPNISVLQKPSPAGKVAGKTIKIAAGLASGGLALGLATALGLGLLFDRTLKRPRELESRLQIPMLISIPRMREPSRLRLKSHRAETRELAPRSSPLGAKVAPWELGHFVRPFAEAIRNRLILGFELRKLTHKPKLIGVTSLSGGEGSSTMAGGLAASLSETGDGKVLLVDMNADNPEMRHFFEGSTSGSLLDALRADGAVPSAGENLFLATGKSSDSISMAPRKFYELMPVLRASTFDYIIFDLPPLDQSGATLAVSGFLDKVVLMVEAEKSDRDTLKRAYNELVAAKADVATVLNKTDSKMPKWAQG
ncbi:MAG: polysaccharide biosynthesis transport protein [Chthoniobacter sp.]|jgi:uncharacterized protein involved in exopolysaccharide biosynthesis/Mrp family chromosome partitioning ATPase|nr:polysaccharide biosynthesis transport protein [Chthoniobacter sp.]